VRGRALREAGETERAVQELERGAALAPESRDIQFALARAYQRAGRPADAERARQEFLRLDQANREPETERQTRP
jgi:predicted Zn-dependent protease